MKKFYQISAVTIVVGMIMALIGWANHGMNPVVDNNDHFTYTAIDGTTRTKSCSKRTDLNAVQLNLENSAIAIHRGDQKTIFVKGANPDSLAVRVEGKKLFLSEKPVKGIIFEKNHSPLELIIPKEMNLKELEVGSGRGDIKVENLRTKVLVMMTSKGHLKTDHIKAQSAQFTSTQSGAISLANSQTGYSNIDVKSGQLTINNSSMCADATSKTGNITISQTKLLGKSSFKMKSAGEFVIKNSPSLSYHLIAGEKQIRYHHQKAKKRLIKQAPGKNVLYVDNKYGSITVE